MFRCMLKGKRKRIKRGIVKSDVPVVILIGSKQRPLVPPRSRKVSKKANQEKSQRGNMLSSSCTMARAIKVVIWLSLSGLQYQKNDPASKTIEGDVENALWKVSQCAETC